MKVRVIAPEAAGLPPLAWWSELARLSEIDGVEMLPIIGGRGATMAAVARACQTPSDVMIWSGHGGPGRLAVADGFVSADWLACQIRQAPPGAVVIAACQSGNRDEWLDSIAEAISQAGINCIGMWVSVEDRAAIVYNVEFLRAMVTGVGLAVSHRVAVKQVAMEWPEQAGAAFLMPGLSNGYGKVEKAIQGLKAGFDDKLADVRNDISEIGTKVDKLETKVSYFATENQDLHDKLVEAGVEHGPVEDAERQVGRKVGAGKGKR